MTIYPSISIIIPTYTSSEKYIQTCILSINNQNYPKDKIEILVVDNESKDNTVKISKKLGAFVYTVIGKPSQACNQRNLGAMKAKGEYLLFLDHDMELENNLLSNFSELVSKTKSKIDGWYIPEQIIASNNLFSLIRNYERSFYNQTVIDAIRIIKKEAFLKTKSQYDPLLSNGPADWDLDIQLEKIGCKFGILKKCVYHHEEKLSLRQYISKKSLYSSGIEKYISKWKNDNYVFNDIIKKQFGIFYRSIGVFTENGKWKKLILGFPLYLFLLILKTIIYIHFKMNKKYE